MTRTTGQAPGSTSGSTDAWTGGVETGVAPGWVTAQHHPRLRPSSRTRAGRRPGVGGPQDPARPADRPGADPLGARRQAGRQGRAGRDRHPAPRPVRGGRAGRRRRLRPHLGEPASVGPRQGTGAAGRWPRSCAARASTTRPPARRSTRSTRTTRRPRPARWCAASSARCPGSTTRRPSVGWSGCWPARATPRGWRSRWSATSSPPRAATSRSSRTRSDRRIPVPTGAAPPQ